MSLKHKWRDLRFKVRVRLNRALHGYDEYDWWEYYSNNSQRAAKLLPYLKGRGCPGSFLGTLDPTKEQSEAAHARWDACIDDMVFFHTICAGDTKDEMDMSDEERARYRRGKYYYFKYYEHLWD